MPNVPTHLLLRREREADAAKIHAITDAAFRGMPYASGDEAAIVDRLRRSGGLALSLVALIDDDLIGHVAFSPAVAADGSAPWFALGPVSVRPDQQRQGVGSALIRRGLKLLADDNALGCILVGDPAYYQRFDFKLAPDNSPSQDYAPYFMLCRFAQTQPSGTLSFHDAFDGS